MGSIILSYGTIAIKLQDTETNRTKFIVVNHKDKTLKEISVTDNKSSASLPQNYVEAEYPAFKTEEDLYSSLKKQYPDANQSRDVIKLPTSSVSLETFETTFLNATPPFACAAEILKAAGYTEVDKYWQQDTQKLSVAICDMAIEMLQIQLANSKSQKNAPQKLSAPPLILIDILELKLNKLRIEGRVKEDQYKILMAHRNFLKYANYNTVDPTFYTVMATDFQSTKGGVFPQSGPIASQLFNAYMGYSDSLPNVPTLIQILPEQDLPHTSKLASLKKIERELVKNFVAEQNAVSLKLFPQKTPQEKFIETLQKYLENNKKQTNAHKHNWTLFGTTIKNWGYSVAQKNEAAEALLSLIKNNSDVSTLKPHMGALSQGELGKMFDEAISHKWVSLPQKSALEIYSKCRR